MAAPRRVPRCRAECPSALLERGRVAMRGGGGGHTRWLRVEKRRVSADVRTQVLRRSCRVVVVTARWFTVRRQRHALVQADPCAHARFRAEMDADARVPHTLESSRGSGAGCTGCLCARPRPSPGELHTRRGMTFFYLGLVSSLPCASKVIADKSATGRLRRSSVDRL